MDTNFDPSASASQVDGIAGLLNHIWLRYIFVGITNRIFLL
jgi:hypothetical protein